VNQIQQKLNQERHELEALKSEASQKRRRIIKDITIAMNNT
jgi:hypothetical protein